ncbi:MAG TPA: CatB-related O-acetyltransferase [Candidatus Borkfalkia excrementavium]|uniref:CatB-related O-acetyltransferase n=1 Tax=Candidatus Borkfalkia excrementavium TaxID=2838505 RepID=A0A9D2CG10_9FIRM|nr:CatB-related O-acetyltransferase [Candidatus Borkfalkia excrementavium]
MKNIPSPDTVFPNEYGTTCFIKNVIKAPNIIVGDYTYYDDEKDPAGFEKNNVLFNYPVFGDKLIIGKFCQIASGTQFIMGAANHRLSSATTYPFNIIGGVWADVAPAHLSQLPHKGDTVIGNDVWLGRNCVVMLGVKIGDGAIVAAHSVVTRNVEPYCVAGGNPARFIKKRFDEELISLLLEFRWWDLPPEQLTEVLPLLCDSDLDRVKNEIRHKLSEKNGNADR